MADNTPRDRQRDHQADAEVLQAADLPVRLVRGNASPDELSAEN